MKDVKTTAEESMHKAKQLASGVSLEHEMADERSDSCKFVASIQKTLEIGFSPSSISQGLAAPLQNATKDEQEAMLRRLATQAPRNDIS